MSANKFVLKHHHIEVDYTIGITPGLPALTYKDGPNVKTFQANEITTDETGLGTLVSVSLVRSIDSMQLHEGGRRGIESGPVCAVPCNGWRLRMVRWKPRLRDQLGASTRMGTTSIFVGQNRPSPPLSPIQTRGLSTAYSRMATTP